MTQLTSRRLPGRARDGDMREQQTEGSFDVPVYELIAAVDRCKRLDGLPTIRTSRIWEVIRSLGYRQLCSDLAEQVIECTNRDCRKVFLRTNNPVCPECRHANQTRRRVRGSNAGCSWHWRRNHKSKPARTQHLATP